MELKSSAWPAGGPIPARYTCDGDDVSPALAWSGAPARTETFALILHDPDAPRKGGFTHWVIYNIDQNVKSMQENVPGQETVAGLGVQGRNDGGKIGYMGPCPPSGTHRYNLTLYALNTRLSLKPGATHGELTAAMDGHVLATAAWMGTYSRER
jgi:Raf kinase inhibitor-like YbhB/YbcL family protein